jgi:prephenate dehydratase
VAEAYDALAGGDVTVVGEVAIPIRHCLLALKGATTAGLREARTHPVALSQCKGFFARHPAIQPRAVYDTAGAAAEVAASGDLTIAAIASRRAGDRYGLEVLEADLQDRDDNQTRFYLIEHEATRPGNGPFKTACVVELENRPGSLHRLVGVFAERGLDLSHVASRPAASPWTYRFILEFCHATREEGSEAIEAARPLSAKLRVLGTFPAWRANTTPSSTSGGAQALDASGRER